MYLVNVLLDAPDPLSPAEARTLLWRAAAPGSTIEHIYVESAPHATPPRQPSSRAPAPEGPAPGGRAPGCRSPGGLEAVLFLSQPTLAAAEEAADAVLERCTVRGRPVFRRRSSMPLTLLVELLTLGGEGD